MATLPTFTTFLENNLTEIIISSTTNYDEVNNFLIDKVKRYLVK